MDPARKHIWQLPVFVCGLAAAAAAAKFTPAPQTDPAAAFVATLTDLRQAVQQRPLDIPALEKLTRRAIETKDEQPDSATTSHYLIGSAYVAFAEHGPASASADHWKLAGQHFDLVDAARLADKDDLARFAFRFAKVKAVTGTGNPAALIPILSQPPADEDKVEPTRLIGELWLKQTPPDRKRARDELARYMALPNAKSPADANRLKLKLASLSFELKDAEQARRWLKDVREGPADVVAAAKVQLARLAAGENDWAEAAKLYEAAQAGLPEDQRGPVRFQTGYALMKLGNAAQASPYLEQAAREAGAVGAAAALRLAELRIRDAAGKGRRTDAADWLDVAANRASTIDDFAGLGIPAPEVRAAYEEVIRTSARENDYPAAARAAVAYAKFADAGKDRERRAEVYAAWATSLAATNPAEAKAKHRAAGTEYAALADTFPTASGKADLYRRAMGAFKQGGDAAATLDAATKLLAVPGAQAEDLAAAHLERAELLPSADPAARASLEQAMSLPGPSASAARLKLAVANLARGKALLEAAPGSPSPDQTRAEAEATLKLGRNLLEQVADASNVTDAEKPTHETAVFELARRLMGEQKYADAEARFRKQLQLYPTGKEAGFGRLWLACCLVQQGYTGGAADKRVQEAVDLLVPLRTGDDEYLRTQADIRTLNAYWVQQKYDEVSRAGTAMLAAHRGKADELVVGKLMFYAALTRAPADPGEALKVLLRMEETLAALPATAFPTDPEYTQERWKRELPALRAELDKLKMK